MSVEGELGYNPETEQGVERSEAAPESSGSFEDLENAFEERFELEATDRIDFEPPDGSGALPKGYTVYAEKSGLVAIDHKRAKWINVSHKHKAIFMRREDHWEVAKPPTALRPAVHRHATPAEYAELAKVLRFGKRITQ